MKMKSYEQVILSQSWIQGVIELRNRIFVLEDTLGEADVKDKASIDKLFNELAELKTATENFTKQFD